MSRTALGTPRGRSKPTQSLTQSGGGLLGYVDALTGGSISKVGLFSLGIVPYINASIIMQLMTSVFPQLKKLQREEGPSGRQKFAQIQKIVTLVFALAQAVGQLNYLRPFVQDFDLAWLVCAARAPALAAPARCLVRAADSGSLTRQAENSVVLAAGAMVLVFLSDEIGKLKLGNGTSILIFANILSSLPSSLGATLQQAAADDPKNLIVFVTAFLVTVLGEAGEAEEGPGRWACPSTEVQGLDSPRARVSEGPPLHRGPPLCCGTSAKRRCRGPKGAPSNGARNRLQASCTSRRPSARSPSTMPLASPVLGAWAAPPTSPSRSGPLTPVETAGPHLTAPPFCFRCAGERHRRDAHHLCLVPAGPAGHIGSVQRQRAPQQ